MRRLISRRWALVAALSLAAGCAAGPPGGGGGKKGGGAPPPEGPSFAVAGIVLDSENIPVGNIPVRILAAEKPVSRDPRLDADQVEIVASADTSPDGSYRLEISAGRRKPKYYLSFYEGGRFDDVLYSRPLRIDITQRVLRTRWMLFDFRLSIHGSWPKVQETLNKHSPASPKARVIRKYGIAEEITKKENAPDIDIWWYYSKGKSFSFQSGKLLKETTFAPVLK